MIGMEGALQQSKRDSYPHPTSSYSYLARAPIQLVQLVRCSTVQHSAALLTRIFTLHRSIAIVDD